jgi:hypothetical protein
MSDEVPQDPTTGELDCLAVLWEEQESKGDENCAMGLSEIHEGVCKRRAAYGEAPPALTTVSTYLRSALAKQLLREVRRTADGAVMPLTGIRTRGALSASRSPQTAYQARVGPSEVFRPTFEAIIHSYPPAMRIQALFDFAEAMGLSQRTIKEIEKLVADKKVR